MKIPDCSPDSEGVWQKHQETKCECSDSEVRLRTKRNGQTAIYKQCIACGASIGTAIAKSNFTPEQLKKLPKWDDDLASGYMSNRFASLRLAQQAEDERANKEWWDHYNKYLDSPEWKRIRKRVLERDKGICQGCLDRKASEVHHLTYSHAGAEFLFQLVSVCDVCHDRLHPNTDEPDSEDPDHYIES